MVGLLWNLSDNRSLFSSRENSHYSSDLDCLNSLFGLLITFSGFLFYYFILCEFFYSSLSELFFVLVINCINCLLSSGLKFSDLFLSENLRISFFRMDFFVYVPFAQFPIDHLSYPVMPSLVIFYASLLHLLILSVIISSLSPHHFHFCFYYYYYYYLLCKFFTPLVTGGFH